MLHLKLKRNCVFIKFIKEHEFRQKLLILNMDSNKQIKDKHTSYYKKAKD
jgi:hypothetical protein